MLNISKLSKGSSKDTGLNKEQITSFWTEKLADIEPLDLFFLKSNINYDFSDNSRKIPELSIQELGETGEIKFNFDREILLNLDKLREKYQITPCLYGQSILAILLNKYTKQDRFCIGCSGAIKKREGLLYEYRVNDIFLYDFSTVNNILDVISQSNEFLELLSQESINPNYLQVFEIPRISNKNLLNILYVPVNLQAKPYGFDNIKVNIENSTYTAVVRDLVFEQEIKSKEIHYRVRFQPDKISSNLLREFIVCYKRVFIEILDDLLKHKALSELTHIKNYTVLSAEQYEQVIHTWNDTDKVFLCDKTINELFEEQVKKTPENIAVIYENTSLKYKELNERANQLAYHIRQNYDIKPDTFVALCLDRSEHMLIAILAVLKAGGAYAPMDPAYPDERIKYILEDTETKLVLTNEIYEARLIGLRSAIHQNILPIDNGNMKKLIRSDQITNPHTSATTDNLAYVIYTSGTTGHPKGVMVEHKGVVNLKYDLTNRYELRDECNREVILQFSNYTFDASIEQIILSLLNGYKLLLIPNKTWLDKNKFYDYLNVNKVTHIHATPTFLEQYNFKEVPSLKRLIFGGDRLSTQIYHKIELTDDVKIINEYGPTETSITSVVNIIKGENLAIGMPITNTKCYVLDSDLIPLPVGVMGELYIGGIGLARGYLNRSDLTAERFLPNPFVSEEASKNRNKSRIYRTGDLVRWLPDGSLEYIGRNDFQVKIRGYRIELGEIEACLSSYKGIKQSVVLAKERFSRDGSPADKYLIGYYVSDFKLDETEISNHLKSRLPEYMVPNIFVHLSNLPLTINGKLDRKALPDLEFIGRNYIAPRNELEGRLCNIWAEALGLPEGKVGVSDDFFMLGGDSILALRLVSKINKDFNSQIKVREILELRCVLNLMAVVNSTNNEKENEPYTPFSLVKMEDHKNVISDTDLIEDIYPASYLQAEMLLESTLDNNDVYYNISSYSVYSKFDKNLFLSIFNQLVNKHELLRAAFFLNNDSSCSVVVFKSIQIDCQIYTNQNSKKLIANERLNHFDYTKPGLFRLIINDLGDNFDFIFSFHHAIEDGWSMASLINEFGQAYVNNKPVEANLNLRYGEFIRNELDAIKNQENTNFWKEYLDNLNVPKVDWKLDKEKSKDRIENTCLNLSAEQVNLVHKISKELKISVDSIFLFAYLKTLSHFTNSPDISIGLVVHNRLEKEGGDRLFGLFLNTVPFRFNFNTQKDDLSGLLAVFDNKLKIQKHQQLPYGYIKALFKQKLYSFVFSFVHLHILSESVNNVKSVDGYEKINDPFTFTIIQKGNHAFLLDISVHADYISKNFLESFTLFYKDCLEDILKDLDSRLCLAEQSH